jgi:hypothetical protein
MPEKQHDVIPEPRFSVDAISWTQPLNFRGRSKIAATVRPPRI